ncbi:MAG: phosphatase PAP2 family protein [Opitutae bacterium]|nr:phosphatase PAP2 family protein [Opitutae bacterium]
MLRRFALPFLFALALVARAADLTPTTADFVAPTAIDVPALLPPPPADGTVWAQAELETARFIAEERTPAQETLARLYDPQQVFKLLAPVLGDWCTPANLTRTAAIFDQIYREATPIVERAKATWMRQRPYLADPSITPFIEKPHNTAYPSGHSTRAALVAALLTELLPAHAAAWQRQAALVRWSRVAGSAHFPSDTIAGKVLGEAIAREMLKSSKLQVALAEVRAELTPQLAKHTPPAPHFLAPGTVDVRALITPPPAADSIVTRSEFEVLVQLQTARTPEQAARCQVIEDEDIFLFGSDVVGPWFTAARLPRTAAFFALVREDFATINRTAKALWPRRRPSFLDARLHPCVEFSDSGAYPSGHGIQSSLWAALLGELMPAHAAGFAQRAAETRRFKLLSGVHYPSDIVAGQILGEAVARAMLASPALPAALAEVRAELAPHLRPAAPGAASAFRFACANGSPVGQRACERESARASALAHPDETEPESRAGAGPRPE